MNGDLYESVAALSLTINLNDVEILSSQGVTYSVYTPPVIKSISSRVVTDAEHDDGRPVHVVLTAENLKDGTSCVVGGMLVDPIFLTSGSIACPIFFEGQNGDESVRVGLSINGIDTESSVENISVVPSLKLSLLPTMGPVTGRNISLRLSKSSMESFVYAIDHSSSISGVLYPTIQDISIFCHFNGSGSGVRTLATLDVINGETYCTVPPMASGVVRVGLSLGSDSDRDSEIP